MGCRVVFAKCFGARWRGNPLAASLTVLALIILCDPISGAHFNPCVSIGVWIASKSLGENLVFFIMILVSQFLGGFLGIFWAWLVLIPNYRDGKSTLPNAWITPLCPVG